MPKAKIRYLQSETYVHNFYEVYTYTDDAYTADGKIGRKERQFRGKRTHGTGKGPTDYATPVPSSADSVYKDMESAESTVIAAQILKKQFIVELLNESEIVNAFHRDSLSERQGSIYSYGYMTVRPAFEALLLADPGRMQRLLSNTSPEIKNVILSHFKEIQLNKDECISFAGFDLKGVSFTGAQLGKSSFKEANVQKAVFKLADLSQTDITEEQLDQTESYDAALLPEGFWPFWNNEFKEKLQIKLDRLKTYTINNIPQDDEKYNFVINLCDQTTENLKSINVSSQAKKQIMSDLTNDETTKKLSKHRNLKFLIGEVVAFILLAGIGYLLAASILKCRTGHFGIFSQPKTESHAIEIAGTINEHKTTSANVK